MEYLIGQGFGLLATAVDISLPQFKKKWQMLVGNILANIFLGLNLVFLGEIGSAIFLFAVGVVQGSVNLIHVLRNTMPRKWESVVFLLLYVGLGFYGLFTAPDFVPQINSRNVLELLPILAAVLNCAFVSTRDADLARKYLGACTGVWMVYHAIIGSTSFFGSFFGVISCIIAVVKFRKKDMRKRASVIY